MDYGEVGILIEQLGEAESELTGGRDALADAPATTSSYRTHYVDDLNAFGNSNMASTLALLHRQAREAAQAAAGNLATVLGEDVVRLQDVVLLFQQTDHLQADQLASIGGGDTLTVYSTHVHSSGAQGYDPYAPDPTERMDEGTADDYMRADQINRFGDILQERPGVVGADLNTNAQPNDDGVIEEPESQAAVEGLEEEGFATDAGQVPGGTHGGRHIDYVITPPGVSGHDPQPVDGGPSDHDGQRVDLTIGRW